MSRAVTRRNQRIARVRNQQRWTKAVEVFWTRETERPTLSARIRELSAKVRNGEHYPERQADIAELERLWAQVAAR